MTVNYSIASTLTVKDELTAVLERIASIGRQVNAEMTNLTKNLSKLGTVFEKSSTSAGKFAETQGKGGGCGKQPESGTVGAEPAIRAAYSRA
jgi:phage-related protein